MQISNENQIADVVAFWTDAGMQHWFGKDEAFDQRFRERFLDLHMAAASRKLDAWLDSPQGALALLILTDQFPRNTFRGTGHMYATDPLARHFAHRAQASGHMQRVDAPLRLFFCLPFTHSEQLEDQDYAVELNTGLGGIGLEHALGHREIIRRFGRFPHRNALLGRESTQQELEFLAQGGFQG